MSNIVCYGEVLWDLFPQYKRIGGAPLNVALRLQSLHNQATLISAIGNDENGQGIEDYLVKNNSHTDFIQNKKEYATGNVQVSLDASGSASYSITENVAWDHIELTEEMITLVKNSDMFLYGTLVTRNTKSYETLLELINVAPYKALDINLRPPFYTREILNQLMKSANFLKINEEEYELIFKLFGFEHDTVETDLKLLAAAYDIDSICMTKGADGVVLYHESEFYHAEAYKVEVIDTVGAGDSFFATLLDGLLKNIDPLEALKKACAIGALVASKQGANPMITEEAILELMNQ
ncbi:MAG: carbohydrate kinase [Bacteroidota bacterium]